MKNAPSFMQTLRTTAERDSEARLKLLVLSSASWGGGAQRASRELTEALRQRGVHVTMLVGRRRPHDPPYVHDVRLGIENVLARADRALGRLQRRDGTDPLAHTWRKTVLPKLGECAGPFRTLQVVECAEVGPHHTRYHPGEGALSPR